MDKVAVLDFGGQYSHLIANRVRRLGVYSEILDPVTPAYRLSSYRGIILSGGPQSVYAKAAPLCDRKIFELGIPVLGICYGHQIIAHLLGGKVASGKTKEYGAAKLNIKNRQGIFRGFREKQTNVWMSHGDEVKKLPNGFQIFGKTTDGICAAMGDVSRNIYGVQFHIEVVHTKRGMNILSNFLNLCEAERTWNMAKFLEQELSLVKERVGEKKVFFLVSGGVDSVVAFTLLHRALSSQKVFGLFIDTGLMRKNEAGEVRSSLLKLGFKNFHTVNAKKEFLQALKSKTDPEEKRKIIGDMFLKIQKKAVKKLKLNPEEWLLGQGTIYPDTIETGGTKWADKIKTHHNRVPEIQKMIQEGLVIEPLKNLYKDEVRVVGEKLGLPPELVWRHPFPGPGLGVRILCTSKSVLQNKPDNKSKTRLQLSVPGPNRFSLHSPVHEIFMKSSKGLKNRGIAKILPLRSVGVQGDGRTYRHPLVLSGIRKSGWEKLEQVSTSLTNRFREINRVCISLFPEIIKTFSITPASITPKRVKLLQEADTIVRKFIEQHNLQRKIWQFPVILAPVSFNAQKGETIILRPVQSQEAMTANFYPMNWNLLWKLTKKLKKLRGISGILYDITHKPPGTIEWE